MVRKMLKILILTCIFAFSTSKPTGSLPLSRTQSFNRDYWYYWNIYHDSRQPLGQNYCFKPQISYTEPVNPGKYRYVVGEYVTVKCIPQYRLDSSPHMQCLRGGSWWPEARCTYKGKYWVFDHLRGRNPPQPPAYPQHGR